MDKLIEKLFETIGPHVWLVLTALFTLVFAFVVIDGGEHISLWAYAAFLILIAGTIAGHFLGQGFRLRSSLTYS